MGFGEDACGKGWTQIGEGSFVGESPHDDVL